MLHFEEAETNSQLEAEKVLKKYDAAYWYTENGNITDSNRNNENGVKTEMDYSYNAGNNQLEDVAWSQPGAASESHTLAYDANGNIVNEAFVGPMPQNPISMGSPQGSFTYDDYDELPTSISTASGTRNYRYDSNGQRIVKEVDANDKNYYLDGVIIDQNNEVVSYQTPEGYVSVSNNGGIIADYFYNVTDWIGTNRAVLDAGGNVVNASDHYPFGKRMPGRIMVTDAEGNRYQFTGHEFDEETGFDYHGARYYNSELGRYMNVDPWQEKYLGWSSYNYTMGNPVNYTDPTGKGVDGDYYSEGGRWLGSDGKNDNKAYVVTEIKTKTVSTQTTTGRKVNVTDLENSTSKELSISNSELINRSATVYGESSAGYGIYNRKEMFAIASVHTRNSIAYGANNPQAKAFKDTDKVGRSKGMLMAMAGVINADLGGHDYSNGATMWDGAEQAKLPTSNHNATSSGGFSFHINTMGWSISTNHYNSWKSAIIAKWGSTAFNVPQQKSATSGDNKGKKRLQSTAQYGLTIFWKTTK